MELQIDERKKNQCVEKMRKYVRKVRAFKSIAKILLFFGILVGGMYALLNTMIPSLSVVMVNDIPKKDISGIVASTSFIAMPCFILSMAFYMLSNVFERRLGINRMDEMVFIAGDSIKYTYRPILNSLSNKKIVVTFHLNKIYEATWDSSTNLLRLYGEIVSEEYDGSSKEQPAKVERLDGFVIRDCFKPSLTEWLSQNRVEIYGYNSDE